MATTHPILGCLAEVTASLKDVADVDPVFMRTRDKQEALLELARVQARVAELKLRVLATASDVADERGARDAAAWLAHETRTDGPAVRREARLAAALTRYPRLAAALTAGSVSVAQAQVIARALEDLPADLDPEVRDRAEAHLVDKAGEFAPKQLRVLGRRILDVVAPEVGEDHERRLLEREERQAQRRTWLTTHDAGDGTTFVKGRLPTPVAGRLLTYLHAYTNPRHHPTTHTDAGGSSAVGSSAVAGDRAPYSERLGKAFCAFLEHTDPDRHPVHGGRATTVLVTLDLQALVSGLGVATTNTGDTLTAAQARRLACTADLVPVVLGGKSEVLDQGRAKRLFQPAQRRAMELRDRTCRAEGCDVPAAWCEAHHLHPWSTGGHTDLADGILLCPHHHHRAHDPRYDTTTLTNGDHRFHDARRPLDSRPRVGKSACVSDHRPDNTVRTESGLTDDDFSPVWTDDDRPRIPRVAGVREALEAYLEHYRATVEMKCRGLTAEQARSRSMPPSTLSLHGLVRHLASVERWWFQQNFERRDVPFLFITTDQPELDFDPPPDVDFAADLEAWRTECAVSREIVAAHGLDDRARPLDRDEEVDLRWLVLRMIAEYAQHCGHIDLLREGVDGRTGA